MFTVARHRTQSNPSAVTLPKRAATPNARLHTNPLWHRISTRILPKLEVGAPNDVFEQEADRVADRVVRTPDPAESHRRVVSEKHDAPPVIQRMCPSCEDELQRDPLEEAEEEEEETIQRKPSGQASAAPTASPSVATPVGMIRGGGQPLPSSERNYFEPRFGADFSKVRVHTDPEHAQPAARALQARAFTLGTHIVFGPNQYDPHSLEGRRLLAHELTHTLQQSAVDTSDQDQPGHVARSTVGHAERLQRKEESNEATRKVGVVDRILLGHDLRTGRNKSQGIPRGWAVKKQTPREMVIDIIQAFRGARRYFLEKAWEAPGEIRGFSRDTLVSLAFRNPPRSQKALDGQFNVWNRMYAAARDLIIEELGGNAELTESLNTAYHEAVQTLRDIRVTSANEAFKRAFLEGTKLLEKAGFGRTCGTPGAGPSDHYDATNWEEVTGTEEQPATLRAKVEPWLAMMRLFHSLGKNVARAGGGTTTWNFDCREAGIVAVYYAHWRTLSRAEFNQQFTPLEISPMSPHDLLARGYQPGVHSTRPDEDPWTSGKLQFEERPGEVNFAAPQVPVGKTMEEVLREAPLFSLVVWSNYEAIRRCGNEKDLPFCESWQNENSWKVGPDSYYAFPFGVVDANTIRTKLAMAVLDTMDEADRLPLATYIKNNIFISTIRPPKK